MIRAVLFDLGNTLVSYYRPGEFMPVLRRCLGDCAAALNLVSDPERDAALFHHAVELNQERSDFAVRPLAERLHELFAPHTPLDAATLQRLCAVFLQPIFDTARPDPTALPVLQSLRDLGLRTAIVSNTPWGSPADAWKSELRRHGLDGAVDATVFCVDVGWRKPHVATFERALSLLNTQPKDALFVGDDPRWDVVGAELAGIRPVLLDPLSAASVGDALRIAALADVVPLVSRTGGSATPHRAK